LRGDPVRFPTLDEKLAIHERLIGRFGGPGGMRDPGLLESALYRPQSGYYEDVTEMAAALFESLLMNHPFVDGNKRVAFFATDVFLPAHERLAAAGGRGRGPFHLIGLLDRGEADFAALHAWIRAHVEALDGARGTNGT